MMEAIEVMEMKKVMGAKRQKKALINKSMKTGKKIYKPVLKS